MADLTTNISFENEASRDQYYNALIRKISQWQDLKIRRPDSDTSQLTHKINSAKEMSVLFSFKHSRITLTLNDAVRLQKLIDD